MRIRSLALRAIRPFSEKKVPEVAPQAAPESFKKSKFHFLDYDITKLQYQKDREYDHWAKEEIFGMRYSDLDTKEIRFQKVMDFGVIFYLAIGAISIFATYGLYEKKQLASFEKRVKREQQDPHLQA